MTQFPSDQFRSILFLLRTTNKIKSLTNPRPFHNISTFAFIFRISSGTLFFIHKKTIYNDLYTKRSSISPTNFRDFFDCDCVKISDDPSRDHLRERLTELPPLRHGAIPEKSEIWAIAVR